MLRGLVARHLGPSAKFLTVGGLVFLIDAALYNLLVFWHPTEGWGRGVLFAQPLLAKVLTISFASCLTYLGNRLWTFGDRPRPATTRSILLFVAVNLIASSLQLSCLAFSRYVLDLSSPLADNISGNLIGQIMATSFRYVGYTRFVFPDGEGSSRKSSPRERSSRSVSSSRRSSSAESVHSPRPAGEAACGRFSSAERTDMHEVGTDQSRRSSSGP